jgi:hypothetical protein
MEADVDWEKGGVWGGEIVLSMSGVSKVAEYAGIKEGEIELGLCEVGAEVVVPNERRSELASNGVVKMVVTKVPINPKMLLCVMSEEEENGYNERLVECGRNGTFAIGDEVEVRGHSGVKGMWELVSGVPIDLRRPVRGYK